MENDQFLSTRFKLFGLLTEGNGSVDVNNFKKEVVEEKNFQTELDSCSSSTSLSSIPSKSSNELSSQQSLGSGTKKLTPILPCFHKVVIQSNESEKKRFIIKVNYDEFQYKTIVISPTTTSLSVCGLLASKLSLNRFTFRLYAMKNKTELHCIEEDNIVCEFLDKLMANDDTKPEIKLLVLRPPPTGVDESMRATVLLRWLNYQLKGSHVVKNLKTDLASGIVLCSLAEILSNGKKPEYNTQDKKNVNILALTAAFSVLESIGVTLVHDAVQQILSGSIKKICNILWGILYKYAVTQKSLSSENQKKSAPISELLFLEELNDWCYKLTEKYTEVSLVDFNKSWRDGLAISAILERYDNYRVSYISIRDISSIPDRLESLFFALDKYFELPSIITPKELLKEPKDIDDMAIIVFLTVATLHLHKKKSAKIKRTSSIKSVGVIGGKAPFRLYVEGMEGVTNKVILLPKVGYISEIRHAVCMKMKLASSDFWLYATKDGVERLPGEGEKFTIDDSISLTIKMVSGSSYYNKETISPAGSPVPSPGPTRAKTKSTKTKRTSLLFRRKKKE